MLFSGAAIYRVCDQVLCFSSLARRVGSRVACATAAPRGGSPGVSVNIFGISRLPLASPYLYPYYIFRLCVAPP